MNDRTDQQLLGDYAERQSEVAFATIVHRYADLVYSTALRMICHADAAKDVTQSVFIVLARNAGRLTDRAVLAGWLHGTTRNLAVKAVRFNARRRAREQEAAAMNQLLCAEPDASWEQIAPQLDDALGELSEPDREALLLRYFKNHDLRTVGVLLGISDDAAQKRVSRAVERLRELFAKRGVTIGASGLAVVISAHAVQAAPVGLAAALTSTSVAAGAGTTLTLFKIMAMTKIQFGVAVLVITGATIGLIVQHDHQVALREENRSFQQQITKLQSDNEMLSNRFTQTRNALKLNLPAPRMRPFSPPPNREPDSTELIARLNRGEKAPLLTAEQAGKYLNENHRSASSLLAAFRATGDQKLLNEATENFSNDPQVAFTAAYAPDASPEERRHWLDAFKQSAPENSLANYLSALDHFKAGRTDQAIQDLSAAASKPKYQDYSWDFIQGGQEAYRSAGYPEVEARIIPSMALVLPQLTELKQLNEQMVNLATAYRQAGDEASAQAAIQMDAALGQRLDGPGNAALITKLVGIAIENIALRQMDPNALYGSSGQTVKDQLDELSQRRTALTDFSKQLDGIYETITAADWISYHDRWLTFGEDNAIQWLLAKYGKK